MIKVLIILLALNTCSFANIFNTVEPVGFLWYRLPKEKIIRKSRGVKFSKLTFQQRDAVLKYYTMEALHKAHFTHSVKDMQRYLALQQYWISESSGFSQLFQKTLLNYPQYDYAVTHPSSQIGSRLLDETRQNQHQTIISNLNKNHGMLFFYRGKNPFDHKQIPIIRDFCSRYKFQLIAVSVDGVLTSELSDSKLDHGQASTLGINYFPALLLVNPKTKKTTPIAYGLTTQDVLEERLIQVATNFKGDLL